MLDYSKIGTYAKKRVHGTNFYLFLAWQIMTPISLIILESMPPTNQLTMLKVASVETMVQKMLFCLTNISAEILLHILVNVFCDKCRIVMYFCQVRLPLKDSEMICATAALPWHQKCWWNWHLNYVYRCTNDGRTKITAPTLKIWKKRNVMDQQTSIKFFGNFKPIFLGTLELKF